MSHENLRGPPRIPADDKSRPSFELLVRGSDASICNFAATGTQFARIAERMTWNWKFGSWGLTPVFLLVVLLHSAAAQTPVVQWTADRLTVRAVNVPLRTLLENVAKRTGITLTGADRLSGTRTVDIRDAHLADALSILLENVNFIVTRETGLIHLRIHSMSTGAASMDLSPISIPGLTDEIASRTEEVAPSPEPSPEQGDPDDDKAVELETLEQAAETDGIDSLPEISGALQSDYREVRLRALQLLVARSEDPDAIAEIVSAFSDADRSIVLTASDLLASIPGNAALEALENQLMPENAEELQLPALRALALRADVSSIDAVRRAAREGPEKVRGYAQQLLEILEERLATGTRPRQAN
jgi:hypothetical protein